MNGAVQLKGAAGAWAWTWTRKQRGARKQPTKARKPCKPIKSWKRKKERG